MLFRSGGDVAVVQQLGERTSQACGFGLRPVHPHHPVSYTHLDVYKRQVTLRGRVLRLVFLPTDCRTALRTHRAAQRRSVSRLSLIHISMCIRDRREAMPFSPAMR